MNIPKYKQLDYLYLMNSKTNLEGKLFLLEQILNKSDEILESKKDNYDVRKIHFLQLDIIAKLCFVIEDFLYLHYLIRKDTKKIYKKIVHNRTKWANNEANYIKNNLKITDIKKIYCYPEISKTKLKELEKRLLKKVIKSEIYFHRANLKEIASFWSKHREIYNIFKHGCSIVTGMFDTGDLNKPSHFYARGRKSNRIKTYMVECSDRLFNDYDNIRIKIHAEYNSIAFNNETRILNKEKTFIPDFFLIKGLAEEEKIMGIVREVNKKIVAPSEIKISLEIKENSLKKFKGNSDFYIIPINKDIMFSYKGKVESKRIKKG